MKNACDTHEPLDTSTPVEVSAADVPHLTGQCKRTRWRECSFDEEQRSSLHSSFNNRISWLCKLAALVIAVVSFGSMVLGQADIRFVLLGLCLSVALLAIALLQDASQHRH